MSQWIILQDTTPNHQTVGMGPMFTRNLSAEAALTPDERAAYYTNLVGAWQYEFALFDQAGTMVFSGRSLDIPTKSMFSPMLIGVDAMTLKYRFVGAQQWSAV